MILHDPPIMKERGFPLPIWPFRNIWTEGLPFKPINYVHVTDNKINKLFEKYNKNKNSFKMRKNKNIKSIIF